MPYELKKRKKRKLKYHSKKHELFEGIWSLLGAIDFSLIQTAKVDRNHNHKKEVITIV